MTKSDELFLQALGAALKNEAVSWDAPISSEDWLELLRLAEAHRVLPMIFQAVYASPAAKAADPAMMRRYRMYAMQMMVLQTRKTAEFLPLLQKLKNAGVHPLVVKGIICRNLYPNPDHRLSSDEDILILPEDFPAAHRCLTELGFTTRDPEEKSYELSYSRPGDPLLLELHRSLFPEESKAYGGLNRFFEHVRNRAVEQNGITTLDPTDHMLYLICHAFKHFLHSGFGIRQVCDMILYANRYGREIRWDALLESCRQIRAEQFAAGLFRIGWEHLGLSLEQSRLPVSWQAVYVEEGPLLEDILRSGVYGSADEDRLHSSNITLQAVEKRNQPETGGSLLSAVFPSQEVMQKKYPYLKEKPMLLPIAWTDRILRYAKGESKASNTLKIGSDRVQLLEKYGILDKS